MSAAEERDQAFGEAAEAPPRGVRAAGVLRWALVGMMAACAAAAWFAWFHGRAQLAGHSAQHRAEAYRCPMHPAIVRDQRGSCPICGMDLVAFEQGPATPEAATSQRAPVAGLASVDLGLERTHLSGVRTAKVSRERIATRLRAVGLVTANESAVSVVSAHFSGWVEDASFAQAGQRVEKGQLLATLSGPEFLTAEQVFVADSSWARQRRSPPPAAAPPGAMTRKEQNALQRLGVAQQDIDALVRRGRLLDAMPIRAPISGFIARKSALPGLYAPTGTELFQLVDLSTVWVVVELREQDAALVSPGTPARLTFAALPGEVLHGTIEQISPALNAETRTLQARIELANGALKLRPGMTADVVLEPQSAEGLTAPADALVELDDLRYVFVALAPGRFEPRLVSVGARGEGRVQILEGLSPGDAVVTNGNFLVEAESRLRAAALALRPAPESAGQQRANAAGLVR